MTKLYLVRHGQTDWNLEGRWQGHIDVPLNEVGRRQAAQIARQLAGEGLEAIYSSDLGRARQTANAIARETGLPVQIDPRLREIHQGEWQGMLATEIHARYEAAFRQRRLDPSGFAPPGGETAVQVKDRVLSAVLDICRRHPTQRVALVSHGFSLAVLRTHFEKLSLGDVWDLIPENDEWLVYDIKPGGAPGGSDPGS